MSKLVRVMVREAGFIRKSDISSHAAESLTDCYQHYFYDEKACSKCEPYIREQRHSEEHCDPCPAFQARINLATPTKIGNHSTVKIPLGELQSVLRRLKDKGLKPVVADRRPNGRTYPMKFLGQLRGKYQPEAVDALVKGKRGVLKSPPRSGKTVMATAAVCRVGKKTLILASQREWLDGFKTTFVGKKLANGKIVKGLTNLPKSKVNFCKTFEDFERNLVCLATVQTFYGPDGAKLMRRIRDMFDIVIVDEVHRSAASEFLRAIYSMNAQYFWGLSGTPNRKDGRYIMVRQVIGPILYQAKVEQLVPRWVPIKTNFVGPNQGMWANLVTKLDTDPKRLKLIAEWAVRDIKAGYIILIPMHRHKAIVALTEAINKMMGKKVAYAFHGKLKQRDRDQLIEDAQLGNIPCTVGQMTMLQTGTNIPPASMLYEVALSANEENAEQRIPRILTPHEGKRQPVVRVFMDEMNVRRNCLRSEWFGRIEQMFKPQMTPKDREIWLSYLSGKKGGGAGVARGRSIMGW